MVSFNGLIKSSGIIKCKPYLFDTNELPIHLVSKNGGLVTLLQVRNQIFVMTNVADHKPLDL